MKLKPIAIKKFSLTKPPVVTVYKVGTMAFSKATIDEYLRPNDIEFISAGTDENDRVVLVKANKNQNSVKINYGMQNSCAAIGNAEFSEQIGLKKSTKYDVELLVDTDGVYLILTEILKTT